MMRLRDRFDRSRRKPSTRNQRIGFAFFWLLVLAYAYVTSSRPDFNTESHLYPAFAIVDHGTVNIDAYHTRLGDESYYRGHYYSDKAPGLSFLAVPLYAVLRVAFHGKMGTGYQAFSHYRYAVGRDTVYFRYAITYILVIVPSALFAVLLWLFLSRFTGSSGWALLLAGAYALGTIAYPYSTWFFSHQIAAVLLFGAFLIVQRLARGRDADRHALLSVAAAGLMAGYAVICEYPTVLIAGAIGCYLLAISRDRVRMGVAFAVGALPAAALMMVYDTLAFGSPLTTGYNHVNSELYHNNVHGGLLGVALNSIQMPSAQSLWEITFGTYRGLFLICPFLLLFFVALPIMWRDRRVRPELFLCVGVVAAYFLLDASRGLNQNGWSGGWSIASRHLTPILPFMILPMAFGLRHRLFRIAFVPLAAESVGMMFMAVVSVGPFSFADHNPIVHELLPQFFGGRVQLDWGYLMGLHGFASLVPLFVLGAALGGRLTWLYRRVDPAQTVVRGSPVELRAS